MGKMLEMKEKFPNTQFWVDSCSKKELEYGISIGAVGATTNPVIVTQVLEKELPGWEDTLRTMYAENRAATEDDIAWKLIEKFGVRGAGMLRPIYESSGGACGKISMQTNIKYYHDWEKMADQAAYFHSLAPNVQVKMPISAAELKAFEEAPYRGVSDNAAHKLGTLTHVGLNTFADPRIEGGKLNEITKEDIVEVVEILGEERLLYKAIPIDVAFIRGSVADESGNVTLERECCTNEATAIAQACRNSGGKVIVQVERVVQNGCVDPRLVKIPGIYVDALVVCRDKQDHAQCQGCEYDGSMTGDYRVPLGSLEYPPMSAKKIIGRRAAMELEPDKVVNLGIGIPEYISMVANEEGIGDYMTLTVEAGPVGGVPQGGARFDGSVNVEAILDQPVQFDFYDGGGVDLAFLGLAQADKDGNINVSKFGPRMPEGGPRLMDARILSDGLMGLKG